MELDLTRYKQITLNDRPVAYRPDRSLLKKLATLFPDVVVFGFGKYYMDYWYVLASSSEFTENHPGSMGAIPMTEVIKWKIPRLVPISK